MSTLPLCWLLIRSARCQGSLYSFLVQENEFKDLEKPDGLRFVQGAEIQGSRARLITPRYLGSNPVQRGLEGKRHPFRCLIGSGAQIRLSRAKRGKLRTFRLHRTVPVTARCEF